MEATGSEMTRVQSVEKKKRNKQEKCQRKDKTMNKLYTQQYHPSEMRLEKNENEIKIVPVNKTGHLLGRDLSYQKPLKKVHQTEENKKKRKFFKLFSQINRVKEKQKKIKTGKKHQTNQE